jgi:hypothetical protein
MLAATTGEVLAVLSLVAILWMILFTILVLIKFNDLLKAQLRIHRALLAANTIREEIAKALQWLVDNSPSGK